MKVLLTGKTGQLGRELQRSLTPLGQLRTCDRQEADLEDLDNLRAIIRDYSPDVIVDAAAYTAVDKAEMEPEKARLVNVSAVRVLAEEAARLDSWLVHYSTDYVFDGKKASAYLESDQALPLSVYGQSKLGGEEAIREVACRHLIFRSSWVYSTHGANFPLAILGRAMECERIDVVSDSFGAPTSASLITDVMALVLYRIIWNPRPRHTTAGGTYHLVASGETSWYDYTRFLIGLAGKKRLPVRVVPDGVFPVNADTYSAAAKRSRNCRLNNKKLRDQFDLVMPEWPEQVERFVDEIIRFNLL